MDPLYIRVEPNTCLQAIIQSWTSTGNENDGLGKLLLRILAARGAHLRRPRGWKTAALTALEVRWLMLIDGIATHRVRTQVDSSTGGITGSLMVV